LILAQKRTGESGKAIVRGNRTSHLSMLRFLVVEAKPTRIVSTSGSSGINQRFLLLHRSQSC